MRVLFVNEGIGGHVAMHLYLRRALLDHPEVDAAFVDVPAPGLPRRLAGAPLPMLGRHDLDFHALRVQLACSAVVRRRLRRWQRPRDVLHAYTQNAVLLSAGELAEGPSVVSTDATGTQGASLLPQRRRGVGTELQASVRRRLEERVFAAATLVLAKSEWAAESLRSTYGIADARLRIVPLGVTVPARRVASATRLPEITFVGASMDRKGGWRLLRVFRERFRGRAVLNLVTREPVAEEPGVQVLRHARPGGAALDEVLARTAVLALPTEMDTFGYAVLEAMARGVPVVATRFAALPELVEDGVSGVLVPLHDDRALGDAIASLLDDPGRRAEMGEAARDRVRTGFDARVTTARLMEVLSEARSAFGRGEGPPDVAGSGRVP